MLSTLIAARLADGTIRLLQCSWLLSEASDASLDQDTVHANGAPVMRRQQELPEAAFASPRWAEHAYTHGSRTIFVLSQYTAQGLTCSCSAALACLSFGP